VRYQVGRERGSGPAQLTCPNTDTDHSGQSVPVLFAPLFLKGRPPPKGKAAVVRPAHGQSPQSARARQKAQLLATVKADRTRAAGILKQIQALQKSVANAQKATGKPVKASSNVTKATAGSTTAASASTKAAAASKAASTKAGSTAKATGQEDRHGDDGGETGLPAFQQQYKSLMAAAAKASAQAAKL
jgi:hypothetical protein